MWMLLNRTHARDTLEGRRRFIECYSFPPALRDRVNESYDPELDDVQMSLALDGLRAWFLACLCAGRKTLAMPSQAVDVAWHEFILMTREYHAFCDKAFGRYLHHTPEAAMKGSYARALQRTVKVLDREQATTAVASIPLLFAIDSTLGIEDGNEWSPDELGLLRAGGAVAWDPAAGVYLGCDGGGCGGGCGD